MSHYDVLVAGETVVDFVPSRPGPLDEVERFGRRAGGAPANVAVGLARLGLTPAFWTRLGGDPFGEFLANVLACEGIPAAFVDRDPAAKTTLAFVAHDAAADRSFTFYRDRAADTQLESGRVPDETLQDVAWVVLGGVPLSTEPSRAALFDLAERARAAGATLVFDPNVRPELWDDDVGPVLVEMLERVDVVTASTDDLRAAGLAGGPEALAGAVLDRGPRTAFLTLGSDGALVQSSERASREAATLRHPGYDVTAVDSTGAGDAFTAGVVTALVAGESLEATLSFANAVAALATTDAGAMTALPDRDAVEALRSAQDPEV